MTDTQTKVLTPPHSKESEMMVLGCMLTNIGALNVAADALDDTDFYFTEHKIIFQTLKTAYKNDKPADIHLICEELKRLDKLKAVGGVGYVTTLAQYAGTSAYIEEYTDLVKSKSILRRMINAAQEVERQAIEDPEDVSFALDEAQQKFFAISQVANPNNGILLKDLLSGVKASSRIPYLKELQDRQEKYSNRDPNDPGVTGIPTHFIDFDKLLNGLNPSNLMILAARPAMGKTALALN
ncbi:MAG TPA: DnaB-like helicase N-terminal domain-containing protein, partial [Rhabdochlamydiaceae bacterium]